MKKCIKSSLKLKNVVRQILFTVTKFSITNQYLLLLVNSNTAEYYMVKMAEVHQICVPNYEVMK